MSIMQFTERYSHIKFMDTVLQKNGKQKRGVKQPADVSS